MSEEWKVVPGHYPGFLEIVGASFKVSVVTDAINLTLEDHIARVRDAHIMAAGKDLLEALELILLTRQLERGLVNAMPGESPLHERCIAAIEKARRQV